MEHKDGLKPILSQMCHFDIEMISWVTQHPAPCPMMFFFFALCCYYVCLLVLSCLAVAYHRWHLRWHDYLFHCVCVRICVSVCLWIVFTSLLLLCVFTFNMCMSVLFRFPSLCVDTFLVFLLFFWNKSLIRFCILMLGLLVVVHTVSWMFSF